jgi:hypothetical protein
MYLRLLRIPNSIVRQSREHMTHANCRMQMFFLIQCKQFLRHGWRAKRCWTPVRKRGLYVNYSLDAKVGSTGFARTQRTGAFETPDFFEVFLAGGTGLEDIDVWD